MKPLQASIALFFLCGSLALHAQSNDLSAPGPRNNVREVKPTKPEDLQGAKATGVIVMMSEHGLQVINPLAPTSLGNGEKMVTKNIAPEGSEANDDRKPYGGIILIGWEF